MLTIYYVMHACRVLPDASPDIEPRNFKTEMYFDYGARGMMIDSYWGQEKIKHRMLWDNHSPTWVNDAVINNNASISKLSDYEYRTVTADGNEIQGAVYTCDKVLLGGIEFRNVRTYLISNKNSGVIGEEMINRGVWKIDFRKQVLTFASSIDSIEAKQHAEVLPATFSDKGITVPVMLPNKIRKNLPVDFGFNGCVLLPSEDFDKIVQGNINLYHDSLRFSTPSQSTRVTTTQAFDSLIINNKKYITGFATNERVREALLGRGFFIQFKYVILDYIGKTVYIERY
jgi:hypothetical protein